MLWEVFFIHLDEGEGNKHNTAKHTQNDKSTVDPKILRGNATYVALYLSYFRQMQTNLR